MAMVVVLKAEDRAFIERLTGIMMPSVVTDGGLRDAAAWMRRA